MSLSWWLDFMLQTWLERLAASGSIACPWSVVLTTFLWVGSARRSFHELVDHHFFLSKLYSCSWWMGWKIFSFECGGWGVEDKQGVQHLQAYFPPILPRTSSQCFKTAVLDQTEFETWSQHLMYSSFSSNASETQQSTVCSNKSHIIEKITWPWNSDYF